MKRILQQAFCDTFSPFLEYNGYIYRKGVFIQILEDEGIIKYIHVHILPTGQWSLFFNIRSVLNMIAGIKQAKEDLSFDFEHYKWNILGEYPATMKGTDTASFMTSYRLAALRSTGVIKILRPKEMSYEESEALYETLKDEFDPTIQQQMEQQLRDFQEFLWPAMMSVHDLNACYQFTEAAQRSTYGGLTNEIDLLWYALHEKQYDAAKKYIDSYLKKTPCNTDSYNTGQLWKDMLSSENYPFFEVPLQDRFIRGREKLSAIITESCRQPKKRKQS